MQKNRFRSAMGTLFQDRVRVRDCVRVRVRFRARAKP